MTIRREVRGSKIGEGKKEGHTRHVCFPGLAISLRAKWAKHPRSCMMHCMHCAPLCDIKEALCTDNIVQPNIAVLVASR